MGKIGRGGGYFSGNIAKFLRITFYRTTPVAAPDYIIFNSYQLLAVTYFYKNFHRKCLAAGFLNTPLNF